MKIHHRTRGAAHTEPFSEKNGTMKVTNRMYRHQTPWILVILVIGLVFSSFWASSWMQPMLPSGWLSAASFAGQVDAQLRATAREDLFARLSPEAQEKRRMERNRVFRYYPPEIRTQSIPTEICGAAPEFNHYFDDQKTNRKSLNEVDKVLNNLFSDAFQETGTLGKYVEVGAYNGRAESNTRFFHECLGWDGLLIDGNPKIYKALVRNRPYDYRMSFSPTCTVEEEFNNKTLPFHSFDTTSAGVEGMAIMFMGKQAPHMVPCGSLTPILVEIFPQGHIDFFSLDAEGAEALVVENLD